MGKRKKRAAKGSAGRKNEVKITQETIHLYRTVVPLKNTRYDSADVAVSTKCHLKKGTCLNLDEMILRFTETLTGRVEEVISGEGETKVQVRWDKPIPVTFARTWKLGMPVPHRLSGVIPNAWRLPKAPQRADNHNAVFEVGSRVQAKRGGAKGMIKNMCSDDNAQAFWIEWDSGKKSFAFKEQIELSKMDTVPVVVQSVVAKCRVAKAINNSQYKSSERKNHSSKALNAPRSRLQKLRDPFHGLHSF